MEHTTTKRKPRAKVAQSWGVKDVGKWNFEEHKFPGLWAEHLGIIPQRFLMYVDGHAGHGKTEYNMLMSQLFANHFGKVRYDNVEQGKHVQIKESAGRNDFANTIPAGKWVYCSIKDFDLLVEQLKRPNSGKVIIIDSISYFPLNTAQIQQLINLFKKKSFVFVGYQAHFNQYAAVRHLCDIKVRVENFTAHVESNRFGGTKDFVIWDKKRVPTAGDQLTIV